MAERADFAYLGGDMASQEIEELASALARLPGLGPRSARRAVLHLMKKRQTSLEPLLAALNVRRRALAEAQRVPVCVIFPDRTLIEMAETRSATLAAMACVNVIDAKKRES